MVLIYNHMVVDNATAPPGTDVSEDTADRVFHALADPTRRDIVSICLHGDHSVSSLARRYPMSFAAVQKHVVVLERAGLVTKRRCGREQLVASNIDTVRHARRLLDQLEVLWRHRVERMNEILADGAAPVPAPLPDIQRSQGADPT